LSLSYYQIKELNGQRRSYVTLQDGFSVSMKHMLLMIELKLLKFLC